MLSMADLIDLSKEFITLVAFGCRSSGVNSRRSYLWNAHGYGQRGVRQGSNGYLEGHLANSCRPKEEWPRLWFVRKAPQSIDRHQLKGPHSTAAFRSSPLATSSHTIDHFRSGNCSRAGLLDLCSPSLTPRHEGPVNHIWNFECLFNFLLHNCPPTYISL